MNKPFIVETDASKHAIGACLLQENKNGEKHPIAFASRVLNKNESKYPSIESEALAIVSALKEFAPYLEGNGTNTIITDNQALCSLLKRKDLIGRLAKYQMTIQPIYIEIVYRKGGKNKICDYISRYTQEGKRGQEINKPLVCQTASSELSEAQIIREQKKVAHLREIYEKIKRRNPPKELENYKKNNGILYFITEGKERIIIPYSLREKIIKIYHEDIFCNAHLGINKTLNKIKDRFYWSGMDTDISNFVRACERCQRRKTVANLQTKEPLKMIAPSKFPFYRIHIDLSGPLPLTEKGNKYIFVAIDSLTKWLICAPIMDQKAEKISEILENEIICQHGAPHEIVSDNGKQFTSEIFANLSKIYGFRI